MDVYQREFLALRDRLHAAEQENLKRSKELNLVLDEIKRAISEKQALRDINRTWSSLSGETHSRTKQTLYGRLPLTVSAWRDSCRHDLDFGSDCASYIRRRKNGIWLYFLYRNLMFYSALWLFLNKADSFAITVPYDIGVHARVLDNEGITEGIGYQI